MFLPEGTRLGSYEILAPLGAGGMGEVYRATDSRLKRQVAIKILPPALAADPDRLARFQREAELLASLNHQHIAAIYGLEHASNMKALVMELVEGLTLADRIAQGPIPTDEALPIARQIAEALEAAHGQGIIHRDLKPANIKVREDGTVKVLDFGLAKLTESAVSGRPGESDLSKSPTLTSPGARTAMGVIVGTAAYMSPEQARGRPVDKRTDIWAFGAVLYEMLTGARAFDGEDITEMMASVVKSTPNWAALPADVPPSVVTLIQRCLEKDRNARIGDIAVVRFLLADQGTVRGFPDAAIPVVSVKTTPRWRQAMPWALAAMLIGISIGTLLGSLFPQRLAGVQPLTRLQMSVVPADYLAPALSVRPSRTAMAISPDGRLAVFSGARGDATELYVRQLDRPEATPLPGTKGAIGPFFSPDGAWIGFWADNKIKKIPAAGGPPSTICDAPPGRAWGASWSEDGNIFFASRMGIAKVSAAGGTPATVTQPDGTRHLLPQWLPGGNAILITEITSQDHSSSQWEKANLLLHSLDNGARRVIVSGGADARFVGTGHLVYMKTGTLMAVPFDLRSLQVTGAPMALIEGVMQGINAPNLADETGAGQFAVSASGTLVYAAGGIGPVVERTLVWVDRTGTAQPVATAPAGPFLHQRLSPDGRRIAVNVRRGSTRASDVWVYDVQRGAPTRLTFDGSNTSIWSPDSKRLVFGAGRLFGTNADGGGTPEQLTTGNYSQIPASWSPRSNAIAFLQRPTAEGLNGIWVLPTDGAKKPRLFLESRFSLSHPAFSPDGRWIAYVSDESGGSEVYVQPYPGPGEKIRVSTTRGWEPIWTSNGREILYRSAGLDGQQFLSAAVVSLSPFRTETPRVLFKAKPGEYDSTTPVRSWDVTADGQRFLLLRNHESTDKPVTAMHVVLNWTEELKRLVRTNYDRAER
jgi:serine/threonine protein kinase/Tol biopolymer transport system component